MKLYYAPYTCSLSPQIVLNESGLPFETVKVNLREKKLPDGSDYLAINPKGSVPTLELDNGVRLTEGPAIVQYIADLVPEKKLAPANGTIERYQLQSWLNYISSELHKTFSPLFAPTTPDAYKAILKETLLKRFGYVDASLANRAFLTGEQFSVADAYLFTVASWSKVVGLDISGLKNLGATLGRIADRPSVQSALKAQG